MTVITSIPEVVNANSVISISEKIDANTYKYNIQLTVNNQVDLPSTIGYYEVQYIDSSTDYSNSSTKEFTLTERILLGDVTPMEYKIRIRYKGLDGRVGPWSSDYIHTVQYLGYFDDTISAISVDLDKTKINITLLRNTNKPSNFSHYEIRVLKDMDAIVTEDFWNYYDKNNPEQIYDYLKNSDKDTRLAFFAHSGDKLFGMPTEWLGQILKETPYKNCYAGSCNFERYASRSEEHTSELQSH